MSTELEERVFQHNTYIDTLNILKTMEEIDYSGIDSNQILLLGRINTTFTFLKESLDKIDPWLISNNTLTNMHNIISNINSYLSAYKNDKLEQHLYEIFSQLEAVLPFFSQLTVVRTSEDIEGIRTSVISFRKSIGQHLANVEKESVSVSTSLIKNNEKLTELTSAIENQKNRIDLIINDFQNQFLNSQTERANDHINYLRSSNEDVKIILTDLQNDLEKQFEAKETDLNERIQTLDTIIEENQKIFDKEINKINSMNQEAEKILGIMSMKGLAQGYQKIANSERKQAFWWNVISITSLLGVIWFGYEFIIKHDGEMSWTTFLSRAVLTGVGITLFSYCAKQASSHKFEERRNRKIELELASLDPYLKDLEIEKQKEIKQTLVDKYFGVEFNFQKNKSDKVIREKDLETISSKIIIELAEKLK